jgi:hypothetical protein
MSLTARPGGIWIEAATDRLRYFPYSRCRENAALLGKERAFGEDLHEVSLHKGWAG